MTVAPVWIKKKANFFTLGNDFATLSPVMVHGGGSFNGRSFHVAVET